MLMLKKEANLINSYYLFYIECNSLFMCSPSLDSYPLKRRSFTSSHLDSIVLDPKVILTNSEFLFALIFYSSNWFFVSKRKKNNCREKKNEIYSSFIPENKVLHHLSRCSFAFDVLNSLIHPACV